MDIREAKKSDLATILEIETLCFLPIDQMDITVYKRVLKSPSGKIYLLANNSRTIGTSIILFRKNSPIARLYSFAIHPDFQKVGYGGKFIVGLQKKLQKSTELRLEVKKTNKKAIKFYHEHGFQVFSEIKNYYGDGMEALRLRKFL